MKHLPVADVCDQSRTNWHLWPALPKLTPGIRLPDELIALYALAVVGLACNIAPEEAVARVRQHLDYVTDYLLDETLDRIVGEIETSR